MRNNQYEILFTSSNMCTILRLKITCIKEAENLCSYIQKRRNSKVYWFINTSDENLEICTSKENLDEALNALNEFKMEERRYSQNMKRIIAHRHCSLKN